MLAGAAGSVDFHTNPDLVGPDLTAVEQAAQQWVLRMRHGMQRPSAIKRIGEALGLWLRGTTTTIVDLQRSRELTCPYDASGNDLQPSVRNQPSNRGGDLGRYPVAVDVPPRPSMAEEAALLLGAKALPQRVAVRPQTVDCRAPADLGAAPSQPAREFADAADRHLVGANGDGFITGMAPWDLPPAGQGDDPSIMPCRIERKNQVHHRQARSDQQRGFTGNGEILNCGARLGAPRVGDQAFGGSRKGGQRKRLLVTSSKYQRSDVDRRAIIEPNFPRVALARGGDCRSLADLGISARNRFIEHRTEIAAEHAPLRETRPVAAFRFEHPSEMIGIAGPGAHPVGGHIEQVRRLGRRISNSLPCAVARFDHDRANATSRKLSGKDRSGGAAADNRDRFLPVRFRSQANSPDLQPRLFAGSYGRTFR